MRPIRPLLLALAAAGMLANGVAAQPADEATALAPPPPAVVDDAEVEGFAHAWRAVAAIRERWRMRLKAMDDSERRQALAQANAEMRAVVEASPLSLRRYNELVVALHGDAGFRGRVTRILGERLPPQMQ